MTDRQLLLKDEIINISNTLQLGISKDDPDWFYKFIERMDLVKKTDSISRTNGWNQIPYLKIEISYDFVSEFKNKTSIHDLFVNHESTEMFYGINPDEQYLCNKQYYQVMNLSKSKKLTEDMVLKYEKVFDQTFGRCGNNVVPYIPETAWKHILENKSLQLEERFYKKPISNVDKNGKYIRK